MAEGEIQNSRDLPEESQLEKEQSEIREAVGLRVLGEKDPSEMTLEDFENSPDLLFHGTHRKIDFQDNMDYYRRHRRKMDEKGNYDHYGDTPQNLGSGFYVTDKESEARLYSKVRTYYANGQKQNPGDNTPAIVEKIHPYQARMFDFRDKSEQNANAPVPRELILEWKKKFIKWLETEGSLVNEEMKNSGEFDRDWMPDYIQHLDRCLDAQKVDLRQLLQDGGHNDFFPYIEDENKFPSGGPFPDLFSYFLMEKGFDGLIYNEGGESKEMKGGSSYVFYNLSKVGTFDTWVGRKLLKEDE